MTVKEGLWYLGKWCISGCLQFHQAKINLSSESQQDLKSRSCINCLAALLRQCLKLDWLLQLRPCSTVKRGKIISHVLQITAFKEKNASAVCFYCCSMTLLTLTQLVILCCPWIMFSKSTNKQDEAHPVFVQFSMSSKHNAPHLCLFNSILFFSVHSYSLSR